MPEERTEEFVKRSAEFRPKDDVKLLPRGSRGIYVLYKVRRKLRHEKYDVMYVGMAAAGRRDGLRGRLSSHARSERKGQLWSHFSAFVGRDTSEAPNVDPFDFDTTSAWRRRRSTRTPNSGSDVRAFERGRLHSSSNSPRGSSDSPAAPTLAVSTRGERMRASDLARLRS